MPTIAQRRLAAQHLAKPALASPRACVAWLGALQAQDLSAAKWAIGQRLRRPSLAAVDRAIERGEILRTWPMRGTLHFVDARDATWMVELLARRALDRAAGRRRELGITPAILATARATLQRALSGAVALARPDAYATLERAGVRTSGQRGVHVLGHLAQEGLLCVGPHEGKQPTVALLAELGREGRAPKEPLVELARRYVRSHAPATTADFAWWTGLPRARARDALGRAARETEDGWIPPRARRAMERSPYARLLPAFDEFAVAYKDRSAALQRIPEGRANPQIGLLSPCVLVDGQMVGRWGRALKADRVEVTLTPFVPWSAAERDAIEAAAQGYAAFLGLELRLR